ncbi:DNA repair protein rad14 [Glugoides intestinalis]
MSTGDMGGFHRDSEEKDKKRGVDNTSIIVPLEKGDLCVFCEGVPVDLEIKNTFNMTVCLKCTRTQLKLITKTKCISDYLLNDCELQHFKHLSRPNPRKGTWNDMQLFLETEIVEFAIKKFDSISNIESIKMERKVKIKERKLKKIKQSVRELKKKTFLVPESKKHIHKFTNKNGTYSSCECGMKIEEEEL